MNQPIKMYDNRLSANVDLYQIGLPDPFGANALIFFDGTILSNKTYRGINFPISIANSSLPSIKELNIDASPLTYDIGPDLTLFLNIRSTYDNKKYQEDIDYLEAVIDYFK